MDPLRSDVLVLKQALNTISFGSPRDLSGTKGKLRATTSQKKYKEMWELGTRHLQLMWQDCPFLCFSRCFGKVALRHQNKQTTSRSFIEGESGRERWRQLCNAACHGRSHSYITCMNLPHSLFTCTYRWWWETNQTHTRIIDVDGKQIRLTLQCTVALDNQTPWEFPKKIEVYSWENHKWGIIQQATFTGGQLPTKNPSGFFGWFFPPDSARGPAPPWPPQYAPRARCGRRSPTSNFRPGPGHLDMPGTIGWMGWQPVEALVTGTSTTRRHVWGMKEQSKIRHMGVGIPTVLGGKWCDCNGLRLDDWWWNPWIKTIKPWIERCLQCPVSASNKCSLSVPRKAHMKYTSHDISLWSLPDLQKESNIEPPDACTIMIHHAPWKCMNMSSSTSHASGRK